MMDTMNTETNITLLKAPEVAARLGISLAMVYRIMQAGDLPTIHIGTAVRVQPSDLQAYIERHRSGWNTLQ
ncbi:MAG: helix-turn-helix domain-containing protein [Chloroflexi bacterium]|nr:helix-turn-helix domain-containing protein [Chloroflexota bacterium]